VSRTKINAADDWFAAMRREFKNARFQEAARIYDLAIQEGQRPNSEAVLLRARVYLKNDSEKVVSFLLRQRLDKTTPDHTARRAMYLGTGYARLGDFIEADKYFAESKAVFKEGALHGELAAHITRRFLAERNLQSAQDWQKESTADRSLAGKVRSDHLQSYIFARKEDYRNQAMSLERVLDLIGNKRADFVEDYCVATYTLAVLARELPVDRFGKRAQSEVDADFQWPSDMMAYRFQALKGVAWCQALAGDELSCLRYLRLAGHVAPSNVWRVILFCDRAYFASIVGESRWAGNEFSAAEELADSIEWERTSGEERIALLLLAELASEIAPKRAPFYLGRFNELGRLRSHLQHFAFDDRLSAMVDYTTGIVKGQSGEASVAEGRFRIAWSTFDRIGYSVRAARAAIALSRLTNKPRWVHLAEDNLEHYPKSWLAKELSKDLPLNSPDHGQLTRMQENVTRLVCEGLSTDSISQRLKISRNTVLNHLKAVYKKLGVNSREALVVKAMRDRVLQEKA
jgi:DNA-binding CsgD family transcriptional regulator